ncbi:hypothetical protein MHYP_G00116470 [Metynnis hypsauchen]
MEGIESLVAFLWVEVRRKWGEARHKGSGSSCLLWPLKCFLTHKQTPTHRAGVPHDLFASGTGPLFLIGFPNKALPSSQQLCGCGFMSQCLSLGLFPWAPEWYWVLTVAGGRAQVIPLPSALGPHPGLTGLLPGYVMSWLNETAHLSIHLRGVYAPEGHRARPASNPPSALIGLGS